MKRQLKTAGRSLRTNRAGKPVHNKILLALPEEEYALIRPELEFMDLPRGRVLYEPGRNIQFVYFPNKGLISLVITMQDSKTVEVGLVGDEGFSGVPAIFGMTRNPVCEIVQVAGNSFRTRAATFKLFLDSTPQLREMVGRYSMVLGMQISQTAACNRLHDIEQRFARWLLMAHDIVHSNRIAITHDFLAMMLGTDRPTVSSTAARLQHRQIINYGRGSTTIVNRKKLEDVACECYGVINQFNGHVPAK